MEQRAVGQQLRKLREQRGLSLRELAEKAGLSFNAISRIEHGENSPTVATLQLLATALEVPITAFFETTYEKTVVFVSHDKRMRSISHGITMESLGLGLRNQQIAPFLFTLAPNMHHHHEAITHQGEEFVYCLKGELIYKINAETFTLHEGDSLLFDAGQPHTFYNTSETPTEFVIIFQNADGQQHHIESK